MLALDTLRRGKWSGLQRDSSVTIALTDVQAVATKHPATTKTVLLVSGAAIVVGGIAAAAAVAHSLAQD